jgi:hypothetical protein
VVSRVVRIDGASVLGHTRRGSSWTLRRRIIDSETRERERRRDGGGTGDGLMRVEDLMMRMRALVL